MSELDVKHQQHGLAEQFRVTANIFEDDRFIKIDSSEYKIGNLVTIRFTINRSSHYNLHLHLIISAMKYKEIHSAVNINVTCAKKRFSEQWILTDGWSEKYLCRDVFYDNSVRVDKSCDLHIYNFKFNVIVSKMIMIGSSLYEDENFTDFRLSTVDGSVGVHKASLAAHSDMFKTMLNGEWKETVEGRIEVPGASLQTLQALKDFMYLGKLPEEGLQTLLQIAVRFFIESLKRQCVIKLAQNVKPEEYLELLDFARDKEIVELTFALVELTPKEVINSAHQLMINSKQLPEVGAKTDTE